MKPFNYKECMEKHGGYAVTRGGKKARLLCDDRKDTLPIVGMVTRDGYETLDSWAEDGKYLPNSGESNYDLFTPTKTVTYWANVYRVADFPIVGCAFSTEAEAKFSKSSGYLKTISFEIEE